MTDMTSDAEDPAAELEAAAQLVATPCGKGSMAWRCWGQGEPLVLLHGGSGSWRHWIRNIAVFARSRQVWCPDLPGMGDSDLPEPPVDAHTVAGVLAHGLSGLFSGRAVLDIAGFSFGGIVGAMAAPAVRLPLRHFVVVGSTALGLPAPNMQMRPWKQESDPAHRATIHRHNLRSLMLARDDALALRLYSEDVQRARYNSRHSAGTTLLRDSLPNIDARVAGIWGALDATVERNPSRAEAALRSVVPDLRFQVIPDAGHWVQYEAAGRFNEALAGLLASAR